MEQKLRTSEAQGKKYWLIGESIFFAILFMISIELILISKDGLNDFYQKKCLKFHQTSIEAVMPESQETDKVQSFFTGVDYEKVESRAALEAENVQIHLNEMIETKLFILDTSSQPYLVEGNMGGDNSIVLPYIMKTYYGVRLNQKLQMEWNGTTYTYVVSGFYEDEILSQQNVEEVLTVYVDMDSYDIWKAQQEVTGLVIYSVQLTNPENTDAIMSELKEQLQEQLFIGGLDLELYGGADLSENVNLYIHYVQLICIVLGTIFALIAVVGQFFALNRFFKEVSLENRKNRTIVGGMEGGSLVVGLLISILLVPNIISNMIASLGYQFEINSMFFCILLGALSYIVIDSLILAGVMLKEKKASDKEDRIRHEENTRDGKKLLSVKELVAVFVASLVLATGGLIVSQVYMNVMDDTDLFYEYSDTEDIVEVFHSTESATEELISLSELTDYIKPVVQTAVLGGLAALLLIYAMVVFSQIRTAAERITWNEQKNLREQALPMLGRILAVTFLGFVLAIILAQISMGPTLILLRESLGISFDTISMNLILCLMLFGGFAIVASASTMVAVQ